MKVVPRIAAVCLSLAIVSPLPVTAGTEQNGEDQVEQLRDEVAELRALVERMQREHEDRIAELKAQIEAGEGAPEETAPEEPTPSEPAIDDEIARLRALAEEAAGPKEEEKPPEEIVYKARGLSLQQLNPEISVSGDLLAYYQDQEGTRERFDVLLRGLELNFQSYLDPFSKMKATLHIDDEGHVDVEEAYYTNFRILEGATLSLGRFRQPFGIVNRWHEDALDQVEYPMALRRIFGDGGLNQTGASVEWALPEWAGAHHGLTLEVTNTETERLFEEETLGTPSLLFHYKNYRDLSLATYLEFGLSGLFGWNDEWEIQTAPDTVVTEHDALGTRVFGADMSVLWEPPEQAMYRNVEWRSELYFLNRDILAPDNSGRDTINAWGAYSYVQSRLSQSLIAGVRLDYYEPDSKDYAVQPMLSLVPLAYPTESPHRWQVAPYLTWWQSEWVLFRTEYDYAWGDGMENDAHVLWFQTVFAAGPHKHERY